MRLDPAHVYAAVVGFHGCGEELEAYLGEHYLTAAGACLYRHSGFDRTPGQHTRYGSDSCFAGKPTPPTREARPAR
jgi:hypothetical protein